jgi:hypothetical protein
MIEAIANGDAVRMSREDLERAAERAAGDDGGGAPGTTGEVLRGVLREMDESSSSSSSSSSLRGMGGMSDEQHDGGKSEKRREMWGGSKGVDPYQPPSGMADVGEYYGET